MTLLTGGTGFIGYYIAHALAAAGRPFRALVREDSDTRYLEELGSWCTLATGDLTDPDSLADALEGVETVVHAAALVSYQAGDEDRMLKVNAGGTANLVNVMLDEGVGRLVYISSVAALNRVDGGHTTHLEDRWPVEPPNTPYARSKFAAEREVWRGQAEGLSVASLYPAVVLGAGDWSGRNTPVLWRRAATGAKLHPTGSSGFVDVRDVAGAVLKVMDRDVDGDRFLLSAANMNWKAVLDRIARSIDAPLPTVGVRRWQSALLWPLAVVGGKLTGTSPLITRDSHRNLQSRFSYDGEAYPDTTNGDYLPLETTIAETGAAFHLSRTMDAERLPPTFLPLRDSE